MVRLKIVTNRKLWGMDLARAVEVIGSNSFRLRGFEIDSIVLREKDLTRAEYLELFGRVKIACDKYGIRLFSHNFIDDDIRENGFIHFSFDRFGEVKAKLDGFKEVGVSVHSVEDALFAKEYGADYVTFGHVFETDCKKGLEPRGVEKLREVCEAVSIKVWAIGGINSENACEVVECGACDGESVNEATLVSDDESVEVNRRAAYGVCMMSGVLDEIFMDVAIEEALKAQDRDETPIGAVIVRDGKVVGRGFNSVEADQNATSHAEMKAISDAAKNTGNWRLTNCEMYVTLQPCFMCSGAIVNSRIRKIHLGATHQKNEKVKRHDEISAQFLRENKVEVKYGTKERECGEMLRKFFENRR